MLVAAFHWHMNAFCMSPFLPHADAPRMDAAALQQKVAEGIFLLKTKYSECPSWDEIIPVVLEFGLEGLVDRVRITPGELFFSLLGPYPPPVSSSWCAVLLGGREESDSFS